MAKKLNASREISLNLYGYGQGQPIQFSKAFEMEIKMPNDTSGVWTYFLMVPDDQRRIMSKTTAFTLGVLRDGYPMNRDEQIEEYQMLPMTPGLKL